MMAMTQRFVPPPVRVGTLAKQDPIMAFASVMTSNLMRQAAARPAAKRMQWLRDEMNKVQLGMGDTFVSKARTLRRRGRKSNQAMFDAMRLVFANQLSQGVEKMADSGGLSGLGLSKGMKAFCAITGLATAGGTIAASFTNPSASPAIGSAGAAAAATGGCNQDALDAQVRIAEANAAAAAATAGANQGPPPNNTMKYVAIGGGVLLIGILGIVALKK